MLKTFPAFAMTVPDRPHNYPDHRNHKCEKNIHTIELQRANTSLVSRIIRCQIFLTFRHCFHPISYLRLTYSYQPKYYYSPSIFIITNISAVVRSPTTQPYMNPPITACTIRSWLYAISYEIIWFDSRPSSKLLPSPRQNDVCSGSPVLFTTQYVVFFAYAW